MKVPVKPSITRISSPTCTGSVQAVVVLGLADDVDGVVGGKHQAHVLGVVALGHLGGEACRLGGGRGTGNGERSIAHQSDR